MNKIRSVLSKVNETVFDVDHMNGSRGVNLESIPDVSTYKDSDKSLKFIKFLTNYFNWKTLADHTNYECDDDNSEIISSSSGEWYVAEMADAKPKPYAFWDKGKRHGWVNTNCDPIKVPTPPL